MSKQIMTGILFFFISCQYRGIPNANKILTIIEIGTDSTYKREYFPNPNKSLYAVLSRYCNAPVETFIYYHDIEKKEISEIKTYMIKRPYGHYFEFYDNGNLKQYCYYVGLENNSSYIKKFSKNGALESEQGNPFVDYSNDDKKNIELHFSTVFFDSLKVEIASKNASFRKLYLTNSSMLPMLLESKIATEDSIFFIKTVAYTKKSGEVKKYIDTLDIRK